VYVVFKCRANGYIFTIEKIIDKIAGIFGCHFACCFALVFTEG
jgi:hypothetical protein